MATIKKKLKKIFKYAEHPIESNPVKYVQTHHAKYRFIKKTGVSFKLAFYFVLGNAKLVGAIDIALGLPMVFKYSIELFDRPTYAREWLLLSLFVALYTLLLPLKIILGIILLPFAWLGLNIAALAEDWNGPLLLAKNVQNQLATPKAHNKNLSQLERLPTPIINRIAEYANERTIFQCSHTLFGCNHQRVLKHLIHLVGQDDTNGVRVMLARYPSLVSGQHTKSIFQLNGTTFTGVTCYQLSHWTGNKLMQRTIQRYISKERAKKEYQELQNRPSSGDPSDAGSHFTLAPLISALNEFTSQYAYYQASNQLNKVIEMWANVNNAYRKVPAHIIYSLSIDEKNSYLNKATKYTTFSEVRYSTELLAWLNDKKQPNNTPSSATAPLYRSTNFTTLTISNGANNNIDERTIEIIIANIRHLKILWTQYEKDFKKAALEFRATPTKNTKKTANHASPIKQP